MIETGKMIPYLSQITDFLMKMFYQVIEFWNDVAQGTSVLGWVAEGHSAIHASEKI